MSAVSAVAGLLIVVLRRRWSWSVATTRTMRIDRRTSALVILAVPILGLALGVGLLRHLAGPVCFLGLPSWDVALGFGIPLALSLVGLGAFVLGVSRLVLIEWVMARGVTAAPPLQEMADRLAARLGVRAPRLLVRPDDRPLAFTAGLWRPTVVLSSWMIVQLDAWEQEAVLAHELAHAARGDYPISWLATLLRDAFVYLPTSREAHRQLRHERELTADDLAVWATGRPLALASALAKVWQEALAVKPAFASTLNLAGPGADLESRIQRLLAAPTRVSKDVAPRGTTQVLAGGLMTGLLGVPGLNLVFLLAPLCCASLLRLLGA